MQLPVHIMNAESVKYLYQCHTCIDQHQFDDRDLCFDKPTYVHVYLYICMCAENNHLIVLSLTEPTINTAGYSAAV